MSSCPSNSWIDRRSVPRSRRCVANSRQFRLPIPRKTFGHVISLGDAWISTLNRVRRSLLRDPCPGAPSGSRAPGPNPLPAAGPTPSAATHRAGLCPGPSGPPAQPPMLPKIPAPKSKTLPPNPKKHPSSPQFISNQSPVIIATLYTFADPPPFEALVGDLKGAYSRRINIQHRLVYQVLQDEQIVKVIRLWTHYE